MKKKYGDIHNLQHHYLCKGKKRNCYNCKWSTFDYQCPGLIGCRVKTICVFAFNIERIRALMCKYFEESDYGKENM
ncbi:MAG: hypothetical protein RR252_09200 [Longicatena sp.]